MAEKKVTSYVCTVTEEQAEQLRLLLDGRGWKFSEQPYARWKAVLEKTNVVAYNSGKLTVQGGGTEDFVTFLLEPEILHTFTFGYEEEPAEEAVDPHGGVDESGKGDFFGPLCIAGVYADEVTGPKLSRDRLLRFEADQKFEEDHGAIGRDPGDRRERLDGGGDRSRILQPALRQIRQPEPAAGLGTCAGH